LGNYLKEFAATETGFFIRLKNFDHFKPRVIFLHVEPEEALLQLKDRLESYLFQLKHFSFKKEERLFHPHITIANRDLHKKDFRKAWEYFQSLTFETEFPADSISLLRHNNKEWEIADSYKLG
jgi:2'-5' RNA ligase